MILTGLRGAFVCSKILFRQLEQQFWAIHEEENDFKIFVSGGQKRIRRRETTSLIQMEFDMEGCWSTRGVGFKFFSSLYVKTAKGDMLEVRPWSQRIFKQDEHGRAKDIEQFYVSLYEQGEIVDPTYDPRFNAVVPTSCSSWSDTHFASEEEVREFLHQLVQHLWNRNCVTLERFFVLN